MRHQFEIDADIQALLPLPAPEEKSTLRTLLVSGKRVDDLVVLRIKSEAKNVLGDGHTRREICLEEGIDFKTALVEVQDRAEAVNWVIRNQLGRRNLTDERRAYYIGKQYLTAKGQHGGDRSATKVQELHFDTAQEIAEKNGVSPRTVKTDAAFAEAVDSLPPEQKETVLAGASGKSKAEVVEEAKSAPKPILCSRCARVGAVKGCSMCKEERAHAAKGKMKRKTAPAASVDPLKDDHGNEIPAKRHAAWADPWIQETYDLLAVALDNLLNARLAAGMNKRAKHYPFFNAKDFCDGYGFLTNYIEDLITHLRDNRPSGVCPCCEGVGCGECRQSGLVPRETYKTLTKKEKAK